MDRLFASMVVIFGILEKCAANKTEDLNYAVHLEHNCSIERYIYIFFKSWISRFSARGSYFGLFPFLLFHFLLGYRSISSSREDLTFLPFRVHPISESGDLQP
jgi:hypothetical protein